MSNVAEKFFREKNSINKQEILEKRKGRIEKIKKSYLKAEAEEELYRKFCRLATNDPDKKFKFEHVETLNTGADLIVIYGKKGIGKTYQISKIIADLMDKDPSAEVILVRNTVSELQALRKQSMADYCPFCVEQTGNNPKLYHKWQKSRYIGFCVALSGFSLESAKGPEYPNVRLIIWDECTNTGKENAGYDASGISRFVTFFDSITRNKGNKLKIYIFGNFHRNTDGKVSDVLLDALQIPYGCTLKLKSVRSEDGQGTSTLLFINTGNLYSGIDTNAKVSLFSGNQVQEDLYTNLPQSLSHMVGSMDVFYSCEPQGGLIFNSGAENLLLLLSSFKLTDTTQEEVKYWMIYMDSFPSNTIFTHRIYTTRASLYNSFYKNYDIKLINEQEQRNLIYDLYCMCLSNSLYYSNDKTRVLFDKQMDIWQKEYDLENMPPET